MKKERLALIASAGILLAAVLLVSERSRFHRAPVEVVYAGSVDHNDGGNRPSSLIFWFTNCTSDAMWVFLEKLEVRDGTNWAAWLCPSLNVPLAPHAGRYATIDFTTERPTGGWRVVGSAGRALTGPAAVFEAAKQYPTWLWQRYRPGSKSTPLNPFKTGAGDYGDWIVLSQEVGVHQKLVNLSHGGP